MFKCGVFFAGTTAASNHSPQYSAQILYPISVSFANPAARVVHNIGPMGPEQNLKNLSDGDIVVADQQLGRTD